MSTNENLNPNKTARIAGFLYLLQIPLGVFGILYVANTLVVHGDAAATASNILANELMFRLSIVSAILCALVTLGTALFLYKLLKPVNKNYAALLVIFTLVSAPIAMLNELNQVAVLLLLKEPEHLTVSTANQLQTMLTVFLDLHEYGIHIVDIFFGLWLFPMGYLVLKSNYIPKIIGVFLIIACFGYLADFVNFFVFPSVKIVISQFTFIGEVMMVFWLLIKGVNVEQWEKRALESVGK
jgi:hypothetical protein